MRNQLKIKIYIIEIQLTATVKDWDTYQSTAARTGIFFVNSGSDLRVRNEICFVAGNGPSYAAPSAGLNTSPTPVTTHIENDKDSVKLDITLKITANAHATGDKLLVCLPTGT